MRSDIRSPPVGCLQGAYNMGNQGQCKQKRPRRTVHNILELFIKFGAGEGIRTLDPNLGKVGIGSPSRKYRGHNPVRTFRSPLSLTASKQLLIALETALSPGRLPHNLLNLLVPVEGVEPSTY
jgi:hypothetical protein